jgi:xanthine/uracil permease
VFTGKLAPTRGWHKPAGYDQERQLGLQIIIIIIIIIIKNFGERMNQNYSILRFIKSI